MEFPYDSVKDILVLHGGKLVPVDSEVAHNLGLVHMQSVTIEQLLSICTGLKFKLLCQMDECALVPHAFVESESGLCNTCGRVQDASQHQEQS